MKSNDFSAFQYSSLFFSSSLQQKKKIKLIANLKKRKEKKN